MGLIYKIKIGLISHILNEKLLLKIIQIIAKYGAMFNYFK
jgi:hypothetical protein